MKHRYLFVARGRTFVCVVVSLLLLAGCASWKGEKGVVNKWRDESVASFKKGQTTQSDALSREIADEIKEIAK